MRIRGESALTWICGGAIVFGCLSNIRQLEKSTSALEALSARSRR